MKKDFAVIFDCDGVMFDSRQANINFYNHLLNRFNLPAMEEKQVPFVHMHTADESVRYLFRETNLLREAQAYRMNMDYTPFIKDMVIEPGLIELLRWLTPKFGLAVATNRSNTIEEVIVGNGLNGFFDIVVSSLDVQNPKPHPESLLKILDFFESGPAQALYVGDSIVDQETALAAGTPFAAYKNRSLEAAYHVNALEEIRKIVGR
jgi:phosphoglycolate phosphatase